MEKILTANEMRKADEKTIRAGTPALVLMERAARAVLDVLLRDFPTEKVLVCCGGGNNGGDGLALARMLHGHGIDTAVLYLGPLTADGTPDVDAMSAECAIQYRQLPAEIEICETPALCGVSVVVDAIFGIGLARPLEGRVLEAVNAINEAGLPVLAIDIPSGVHADSGAILSGAIAATKTVAIAAKKYGHILFPGAQLSGEVSVADIGIKIEASAAHLLNARDLAALPPRPRRAHKGTFGRVLIVGGSKEMSGAALLAAKAAYRAGAGLVEIFAPEENRLIYEIALPEAIVTCYREENVKAQLEGALARADAIAIGMGLSVSDAARTLVDITLDTKEIPLVIDADALNLIAKDHALRAKMYLRERVILTPHPMELSRLMATPLSRITGDLASAASSFAGESGKIVVLKDAHTVIANKKQLFFNTYGNSGMATGGSGDVLAGIIAAFVAAHTPPIVAASCGVLAHALAGDAAKAKHGNHGLMASDIIESLGEILP